MSQFDAVRLADQASFGPTEALVSSIRSQGASAWVTAQMALPNSSYTSGMGGEIHQHTGSGEFCTGRGANCWRDDYSTEPLAWDFYRNAITRPDQLCQRVAFALQQIVVVNSLDVSGNCGFRNYHNVLLREAFGNYRQVLKKVVLSPVMGDFLNNANNANNDRDAPNENFARELLQLFSIGTCELNSDGTLRGGTCTATCDNDTLRACAYALTGWTYPVGGATSYGCWPTGANCRYYGGANDGDMVPVARYHDTAARPLLNGHALAAGHTAPSALETVLDSVMTHPNTAPFIGKQLIQHLASSNPFPAYVARVATAFSSGRYQTVGSGQRGDLAATVAAVLLDAEARGDSVARSAGKLREPVQMFTGVLRGLNGASDGEALSGFWGEMLRQHVFRAPSVFNFLPARLPGGRHPAGGPDLRHPQRQHGAVAAQLPHLPARLGRHTRQRERRTQPTGHGGQPQHVHDRLHQLGTLVRPMSEAQFRALPGSSTEIPSNLFSHSDQQIEWETGNTHALGRSGWGRRASAALQTGWPATASSPPALRASCTSLPS